MHADQNALLDAEAIAARIPHAGRMSVLDRVLSWDDESIVCEADPAARSVGGHPLARHGGLPAAAAIEYAAQAMALHGALIGERDRAGGAPAGPPPRGFLAALRTVRLHGRWIDVAPEAGPLTVRVTRFAGDAVQVLYDFEVGRTNPGLTSSGLNSPIAAGRAIVILDAVRRGTAA